MLLNLILISTEPYFLFAYVGYSLLCIIVYILENELSEEAFTKH